MVTGIDELERLLARSIGLDPASLGASSVRRAVDRRLKALGIERDGLGEYVRRVRGSREEFQELVEELVVPETWFFRDGRPFAELRRQAAGWLGAAGERRGTFRVLSVPCSSGEEPYSIAMTLIDLGMPRDRFAIDAIDISARALERARRGVYGPRSLRAIDPTTRHRHFRPHAEGFAINPEVARCVRFLRANLLDAEALALPRGTSPYDAIFCRNLLIYFDEPSRRRAVEILDRLLADDGLLFVGHAEQLPLVESRFTPRGSPGCFCFARRRAQAAEDRPRAVASGGSTPESSPTNGTGTGGRDSRRAGRDRLGGSLALPRTPDSKAGDNRLDPLSPPGSRHGEEPSSEPAVSRGPATAPHPGSRPRGAEAGTRGGAPGRRPPEPRDALAEAAELANRHDYDRAAALCEQVIRRRGPSAEVFHLLGAIRLATGDLDDAERWLSKAVYLDANHEDALLALALIAGRRGDRPAAERHRRRADRARRRKADS